MKKICEMVNFLIINVVSLFFFSPVYGKTGVHMLLRGHVKPVFSPYLVAGQNGFYPESFISLEESDLAEEDASCVTKLVSNYFTLL